MGTYRLSPDKIEEVFEKLDFDQFLERDYSEKNFISASKKYINELRKQGAFILK